MIEYQTRAQGRAIAEAEAAIAALDSAIEGLTEQLADARDEAGRLEDQWNDLGSEMVSEREVAVDPHVGNEAAARARDLFHQLADRRLGLLEPRQQAATRVVDAGKRLELLRRHRERATEQLAALQSGAAVPDPEPIAEAVETEPACENCGMAHPDPAACIEGHGDDPPPSDPDVPAGPVDLLTAVSTSASSEPVGAPAPARRGRSWWSW